MTIQVPFSNQSITVRVGNLCGESSVRNLTGISGNISFCNRVSNGNDKSELSIYPNPANQILYLTAKGDIPQNIEIYNLLGILVKNQASGNEVILKDLVEGVYVLKAIINQKVVVRRFEVVR
ncbi:MAG: T9SS type A sorting domain-containing protein [Bacteroidetes bacterium]|nr:T9SS type A sorting domain-containing protein [Bacteroidota bacterium]